MEYLVLINNWSLFVVIFLSALLFPIYLYIVIGLRKKFDPMFKNVDLGISFFPPPLDRLDYIVSRGLLYALFIAYPGRYKKTKSCFNLYRGYNFRKDCNKLQIILAWSWDTSFLIIFLIGLIHLILSLILGVPFDNS